LIAALQDNDLFSEGMESELYLSEYGERMLLEVELPEHKFDPGDGYPIQISIQCQNSVDKSCALEITIVHFRLVCQNGLVLQHGKLIRKTHLAKLDSRMMVENLSNTLKTAVEEQALLVKWFNKSVTIHQVNRWADDILANKWNKNDAARVCSIARSGYDGTVKPVKKTPPSLWQVGWNEQVPGASSPVNNVYHVSQALSWIASREKKLEDRLKKTMEIYGLVKSLLAELN
jgi:hypothetical protein